LKQIVFQVPKGEDVSGQFLQMVKNGHENSLVMHYLNELMVNNILALKENLRHQVLV
jgi:hypothetical protein